MQLPLVSSEQHPPPPPPPSQHQHQQPQQQSQQPPPPSQQPPVRTQYGYVTGSSAPPPLSVSTTALSNPDHSLIPRYVDPSPRPNKSPRHASHSSIPSTSSITNNESTSEYRYGPPGGYVSVNNSSSEVPPSAYNSESGAGGSTGSGHHGQQQQAPSRVRGGPARRARRAPASRATPPTAPPLRAGRTVSRTTTRPATRWPRRPRASTHLRRSATRRP